MPLPYIVFTDLDGTLLDHATYAYDAALPGLRLLHDQRIPLIFCSAKTRAEQEVYRDALNVRDPFIVENGGAVIVEPGYFRQPHPFTRTDNHRHVLEFARPYPQIRRILEEIRTELNLPLRGYGDMTIDEVVQLTSLDRASAARAMNREYEETVVTPLAEQDRARLREALARRNVSMTAGARFISISTSNDKGRAVRALTDMFRREQDDVVTVGIGDSWNDAPMLAAVDIPLLVQRPGNEWAPLAVPGLRRIESVGPDGWTRAMQQLVTSGFSSP